MSTLILCGSKIAVNYSEQLVDTYFHLRKCWPGNQECLGCTFDELYIFSFLFQIFRIIFTVGAEFLKATHHIGTHLENCYSCVFPFWSKPRVSCLMCAHCVVRAQGWCTTTPPPTAARGAGFVLHATTSLSLVLIKVSPEVALKVRHRPCVNTDNLIHSHTSVLVTWSSLNKS